MLIDAPAILLIFNALNYGVIDEHYFWYPYVLTAFSVGTYYLYRDANERHWLIIMLVIYFFGVVFMDNILDAISDRELAVQAVVKANIVFYKLPAALIYLFVNLTLFSFLRINSKYEQSLKQSRVLLNNKNHELAQKNKTLEDLNLSKDKFFRVIGHDLRNLTGLSMQISNQMAKNQELGGREEDQAELVRILQENTHKEFKLLQDLLDWAKSQSNELNITPIPMNTFSVANETIELLDENARVKNINLINRLSPNTVLKGDPNMIKTVMRNLVANAIKFTPDQGKITISERKDNQYRYIDVTDTGVGIPQKHLDTIFNLADDNVRSGTQGEKGTGLGLQLCSQFLEKHNGRLEVKSEEGKGSTFSVVLPLDN